MRLRIALAIITLSASLAATGSEIPADKDIIVFSGKLGNVTFHHKLHAGLEQVGGLDKVECTTCHHTYQGEGAVQPCSDCHVRGSKAASDDTPDLKKAFHYRCRGCHKYTMEAGKSAGPDKKCKLCHVK